MNAVTTILSSAIETLTNENTELKGLVEQMVATTKEAQSLAKHHAADVASLKKQLKAEAARANKAERAAASYREQLVEKVDQVAQIESKVEPQYPTWATYDEWKALGRQVMAGESHRCRRFTTNEALFAFDQTC